MRRSSIALSPSPVATRSAETVSVSFALTALVLGIRHGIDWDHIAAIADLTSTAENRRKGFVLSLLYAVGHGVVVLVLGMLAILLGAVIPEWLEEWMGYVVGGTLIALGLWIVVDLIRRGRDFRLRSRWMLILDGTFAGFRAVRSKNGHRVVALEHEHEHEHEAGEGLAHGEHPAHDHAHIDDGAADPLIDTSDIEAIAPQSRASGERWAASTGIARRIRTALASHRSTYRHSHRHHHELHLPSESTASPTGRSGNAMAAGVGMLHGVGVESPTQIAIFVASTSLVGVQAGMLLLVAWVAGLIVANSVIAVLAGFGVLNAERNFVVYVAVALFVAAGSVVMGVLLLLGIDALPSLSP